MSVIFVAMVTIENKQQIVEYQTAVLPNLAENRIDVLAVDDAPVAFEGETRKQRMVVLKFRNDDHFNGCYASDTYAEIMPLRLNSSQGEIHLLRKGNFRSVPPHAPIDPWQIPEISSWFTASLPKDAQARTRSAAKKLQ